MNLELQVDDVVDKRVTFVHCERCDRRANARRLRLRGATSDYRKGVDEDDEKAQADHTSKLAQICGYCHSWPGPLHSRFLMPLWFAAVLGLVQGLTEFLPISSTAHLRIVPELLGQADPGAAFSAVIQLGTLLAVLIYFRRDLLVEMPRAMFKNPRGPVAKQAWLIAAGTVPIVIAGLFLKEFVTGRARSLWVVAGALIVVGIVFFVAERRGRSDREISSLWYCDAIIIGLAQACALIPGVSRSGATIAAALFLGVKRPAAARFSFLLGVPAIAGAGIFALKDAARILGESAWLPIAVGTGVSAVVGYLSIAWLLRFLRTHSLVSFGVYRIALGIALILLCLGGKVAALSAADVDARVKPLTICGSHC